MNRNSCNQDTLSPPLLVVVIFASFFISSLVVEGTTDPNDLQALQVLYASLNSPSQLTNWKSNGGDPCGESWKGITCQAASVVSIQIPDLGLNGTLGYMLNGLTSLKNLDMSGNNIHDSIPYQLPPNLTSLNLANNNISGNIPYSIAGMVTLSYLNLSRNSLSQTIGDVFTNHSDLESLFMRPIWRGDSSSYRGRRCGPPGPGRGGRGHTLVHSRTQRLIAADLTRSSQIDKNNPLYQQFMDFIKSKESDTSAPPSYSKVINDDQEDINSYEQNDSKEVILLLENKNLQWKDDPW